MRGAIPGDSTKALVRDTALFYSRTVRATIMGVNTKKGTVKLQYESAMGEKPSVHMPISQLSYNRARPMLASWDRHMPQVDDVVLVSFDPNGTPRVVAYDVLSYEMIINDEETQQRVGFRELQPGEFDKRSSGGAYLYGNAIGTLFLAGGLSSIELDKMNFAAEYNSGLHKFQATNDVLRFGDVKRLQDPTAFDESKVSGVLGTEQEFLVDLQSIAGLPIAKFHLGNIVEADTATGYIYSDKEDADTNRPLKLEMKLWDSTGLLEVLELRADDLGNMKLTLGDTATTGLRLIGMFGELFAQFLTATLKANTLNLGGNSPTESLVLGNVFQTMMKTLLSAIASHTHLTGTGPTGPPVNAAAFTSLKTSPIDDSLVLSQFVKTQRVPDVP